MYCALFIFKRPTEFVGETFENVVHAHYKRKIYRKS